MPSKCPQRCSDNFTENQNQEKLRLWPDIFTQIHNPPSNSHLRQVIKSRTSHRFHSSNHLKKPGANQEAAAGPAQPGARPAWTAGALLSKPQPRVTVPAAGLTATDSYPTFVWFYLPGSAPRCLQHRRAAVRFLRTRLRNALMNLAQTDWHHLETHFLVPHSWGNETYSSVFRTHSIQ